MRNLLANRLEGMSYEPSGWDNEFYVSIGRAAELSGLSESQIRYFESLAGVSIGKREGPSGRNRVYTKQDVRLLRWVYECSDFRPAEIAQFIKEHQEEILERLGRVTLPQIIRHEQIIVGLDVLISGLAVVLLTIWQEALDSKGAVIQGAILGQQNGGWKASFLESLKNESAINLANCLVIWSISPGKDGPPCPRAVYRIIER